MGDHLAPNSPRLFASRPSRVGVREIGERQAGHRLGPFTSVRSIRSRCQKWQVLTQDLALERLQIVEARAPCIHAILFRYAGGTASICVPPWKGR